MLLKVEKTMSGQKVCKGESMKAGISKGMIRESYKHLASLGVCEFFKIFRTIQHRASALSISSSSEELQKAGCMQRFSHLIEHSCTVVSKLGVGLGSGGWRVLRRLRVLLAVLPCCRAAHRPSCTAEPICSQGVSPKSAQIARYPCVLSRFGQRRVRKTHKKSIHECEKRQRALLVRRQICYRIHRCNRVDLVMVIKGTKGTKGIQRTHRSTEINLEVTI